MNGGVNDDMNGGVFVQTSSRLRHIFSGTGRPGPDGYSGLVFTDLPAFTEGDTFGMMVDCSGQSTLLFFVNGAIYHEQVMMSMMEGVVLFPAFQVDADCGEIEIFHNPGLPDRSAFDKRPYDFYGNQMSYGII